MANSTISDEFYRLFVYNTDYNVLICKNHRYGIRNSALRIHLNSLHSELNPKLRSDLSVFGHRIFTDNPIYPTVPIVSIPFLPIFENYYQCLWLIDNQPCFFFNKNLKNLKVHLKNEHGWINERKRGRYSNKNFNSETTNSLWKSGVFCQKFFYTGPDQRFFEVLDPNRPSLNRPNPIESNELIDIGTQKLDLRLREINRRSTSLRNASPNRLEPNPWLDRIGWARHLADFEKSALRKWIDFPNSENEDTFFDICLISFTELVSRAQKTARITEIGLASLEYINRKETGEEKNSKPFHSRFEKNTIKKYSNIFIKILLYLFNTWDLDENERPKYRKSQKQIEKFDIFQISIRKYLE